MEVISLADARQLPGVDHVQGGGKHVSCLFESPALRDLQVRSFAAVRRRPLFIKSPFTNHHRRPTDPNHIHPVHQIQRALNGRKIGIIAGDYIRFPPDYLRKCYVSVVKVRTSVRPQALRHLNSDTFRASSR